MSTEQAEIQRLKQIVKALQQADCFSHAVQHFEVIETHISILLLTGDYAYKFKKPVDLGFVDFTSLDKRQHYCTEEIRLNRRLAPELYLDVVAVGGSVDAPVLNETPAIEYCVQMRQFPRSAELENALAEDRVDAQAFRQLATSVAAFHDRADAVSAADAYGRFDQVRQQCLDNFDVLNEPLPDLDLTAELKPLESWTRAQLEQQRDTIEARREAGRVRECHGDMHVTNMIWLDGSIQVFDCIEFNPELRWIDVQSEIAFLLMDLDMRGHHASARVFLNAYLEAGGDYAGLRLLPLFQVYRSLVRAKIAYLRLRDGAGDTALAQRIHDHVQLAQRYGGQDSNAPARPPLVITHGLSGSGKTTISDALIPLAGALRVRSDVERKRLQGLAADAHTDSGIGQGVYDPASTARTYARLADCARAIIASGRAAIVDATFLQRDQRQQFQALAAELNVPFRILDCQAPAAVLRQRVQARAEQDSDASEADLAVLEQQLSNRQPFSDSETTHVVALDTCARLDSKALGERLGLTDGAGTRGGGH
ncbi:aminoglycoside phosphotransferase family enzyme/predicted kinase [Methylohalomonas lacus]|uniref:Aminoglycoside phosphotransferase family enzyme/predicted kinase n=1 Tax=Methylohalomonas lacus TaxID=398773 RepID=A0AAE3HKN0_9GAMM|nr:bifunctional aminoglycoside phosphotransferase/ATP-binding protein [Methylohalomonas lacus]MCS3903994.1 aminoglycoside phosphotransferase family enzyme/predicted kinase [Methylohalomonas lacus]